MPEQAPAHDCVGALLLRADRVLLGLRAADAAWLAGAWDIFGGHIEAGESPRQALARELAEELGIAAVIGDAVGALHGHEPEPWSLQVFAVRQWQGEPRNLAAGGHVEMRWCTLAEATQRLMPAHRDFAALLASAMNHEPGC